mgnify:CR=1 FL=1|jgi:hypothetical protein
MRKSLRKALLWQGVGLLFTTAGMLIFLVVAVNVYLAPPANSLENMAAGDITVIVLSVALLVIGRVVAWKFGDDSGPLGTIDRIRNPQPEQSRLEELGYRMPPEESPDSDPDTVYEDGELVVRCPECGAKNETGFDYCGDCSARLPD